MKHYHSNIQGQLRKYDLHSLFNFEGANRRNKSIGLFFHVPSKTYGGVAQLGEHLPCTQGVRSSILLISTTNTLETMYLKGQRDDKSAPS